jgi:hypothetical protein
VLPAAVFFWGGGEHASPVSGGVIVLIVLALLLVVPALVGLLLRGRDARRARSDDDPGTERELPPRSGRCFSWDAGEPFDLWAPATRQDWLVVGAFAVGIALLLLLTQL